MGRLGVKFFFAGMALLFCISVRAQKMDTTAYKNLIFYNEFDSSEAVEWQELNNAENLMTAEDGIYIIKRKVDSSPLFVPYRPNHVFSDMEIETSMKIIKGKQKDSYAGIIFMYQEAYNGFSGLLSFEINNHHQYRVRKITSSGFFYITGDSEKEGWVSANSFVPKDNYNKLTVYNSGKYYEVYLNGKYLTGFSDLQLSAGQIRFSIARKTEVHIDYVKIFEKE